MKKSEYSEDTEDWDDDEWKEAAYEYYSQFKSRPLKTVFKEDFELNFDVKSGQVDNLSIYHVNWPKGKEFSGNLFFNNEHKLVAALFW